MKYIHALATFRLRGHDVSRGQVLAKADFRRDDVWKRLVADGRAEEVDTLTPKRKRKEETDGSQLPEE